MHLFGRDLTREVAIIAEIGVNHEGDVEVASRLLAEAARAGAHAVKFQSYTPARFVSADTPERLERVTRFGLDAAAHRRLAAEARGLGVAFLSAAITEDWVDLIAELAPAIKIASGDLTFEPVIRAAAATGKPVILSTGLGTVEEIDHAVAWVADEVGAAALAERLVLMHCVSAYPTPTEEANVLSVPFLAARYGVTAGYSNHVIGPEACWAAIAQGARVVEVHLTERKTGRDFRDHALSFEPADLAHLVATAPKLVAALGRPGKSRQPAELPLLSAVRKGVVAARDLPAGTVLAQEDLMYARPADGFPAAARHTLPGRRLKMAVGAGHSLKPDHLSPTAGES